MWEPRSLYRLDTIPSWSRRARFLRTCRFLTFHVWFHESQVPLNVLFLDYEVRIFKLWLCCVPPHMSLPGLTHPSHTSHFNFVTPNPPHNFTVLPLHNSISLYGNLPHFRSKLKFSNKETTFCNQKSPRTKNTMAIHGWMKERYDPNKFTYSHWVWLNRRRMKVGGTVNEQDFVRAYENMSVRI